MAKNPNITNNLKKTGVKMDAFVRSLLQDRQYKWSYVTLQLGNWCYFTHISGVMGPYFSLVMWPMWPFPRFSFRGRQYDPPQRRRRLVGGIDEETSNDHCASVLEMVPWLGCLDSDML